jgi:glycosyltransferase involved in cell wall biosynthesis
MIIFQLIQKPQLRGVEVFTSQLSKHLEHLGHTVYLICLYQGDADLDYQRMIKLNRPLRKRFYDIKGWKHLANIIKEKNPDLIQVNAADTLKFGVFSKILFKWEQPIVYRNANKMGDFIKNRMHFFYNKFLVEHIDYTISVSDLCSVDFVRVFNYDTQKQQTTPIGIENKKINDFPSDLRYLKKKGPLLLNIAGFVPEKNHIGLIYIFEKVLLKYPSAQLLLIGKGKLEDNIRGIVCKRCLSDSIHFFGYRKDVLEIMKGVDVFVLSSLIEGLPGVILEAMYCKIPVIAYNVGGISEVIKPGETGWLINKDDEQGFVAAIGEALNYNEKESMINNAYKLICSKYMNSQIAKQFENTYQKLCQK